MENKIIKLTVEYDGEVKQIEGEGIIAVALTQNKDNVEVTSCVLGVHGTNTIAAAIGALSKVFGERWTTANALVALEKLYGDAEQPEEQPEEQTEADHEHDDA